MKRARLKFLQFYLFTWSLDDYRGDVVLFLFKHIPIALIICAFCNGFGVSLAHTKDVPPLREVKTIPLVAQPFVLNRKNPEQKTFGKLKWLGGLVLSSPSSYFGGVSGLVLTNNGRDMLAITDRGQWVSARIRYQGDQPVAMRDGRMGPLLNIKGNLFNRRGYLDAEAITPLRPKRYLIASEQWHAIRVFSASKKQLDRQVSLVRLPPAMRKMEKNKGLEALDVFRSGPYKDWMLAFSEFYESRDGYLTGWLLKGRRIHPVYLKNMDDYNITDIAILEDNSVLVLERYFRISTGVKMRIRHIKAGAIKPKAKLYGTVLLDLDRNYRIDNMEGLSVHTNSRGKRVLSLISDDNFNFFQRTLFMQFELLQ